MSGCVRASDGLTKIGYPKRSIAVQVARKYKRAKARAYHCPACRDWHITTQPKNGVRSDVR